MPVLPAYITGKNAKNNKSNNSLENGENMDEFSALYI